ncbi:MAG: hypothetical protein IJ105_05780 [Bacilli bacterium]|nr:hypothetical protein [Bacilli bacterium]
MFPNQFYSPIRSLTPLARKTINWSGLLSNTQKTLNIVNQAIPIVYQIKPIVNNARTMLRVANEFTKTNSSNNFNNNSINNNSNTNINYDNNYTDDGPNFFI